jgi:hypothetical protein
MKPSKLAAKLAAQAEADAQAERELRLRSDLLTAKEKAVHAEAQRAVALREAKELRALLDAAIASQPSAKMRELAVKPRERSSRVHEATAVLLYSDIHPEERVTPETVSGLNEFNLEIAKQRNADLARATLWNLCMLRDKGGPGYRIRDFILALLGDLISNTIHPELMESNLLLPAEAILFAEEMACVHIDTLLTDSDLETINIPCCHGNHDRMTIKIRHQTKAGNSLAWILYHHLRARYRDEPRVKFDIARGNMLYTDVYGRPVRWTHGDDIRYNGGVLGVGVPMQKAIDAWNRSRQAYLTCCGHYHQFCEHREYVMNGSMIGYTAFAQAIKARWEPASQAMFILDKDYGKGWTKAIQLQGKGTW